MNTAMEIDPHAPVVVTGASGYIASWIVKKLLEAGRTVHATVRNPDRTSSVEHLQRAAEGTPGKLLLFKADLLVPGSFDAAMAGAQVVMHTASPFLIGKLTDPEAALVRPALEGTRNVLDAVDRTESVKRVVLTSSVAAIYGDAIELEETSGRVFTEAQWNRTSSVDHNPYPYSKVRAEQEAQTRAKAQARWDLVCINPGFVFGPSLTKSSDSYSISTLLHLGRGKYLTGVPKLYFGCVDVRDVAEAHIRAAFTPSASGRYIVVGEEMSMLDIANRLRKAYGSRYPLPRLALPKAAVWLLGPLSAGITRKFVERNVGYPVRFDNGKSRRELGLSYRSPAQAVVEQFQQLLDDGLIRARAAAE
jgi:nucleoside-diphosphate-sugar epimerase